MKGPKVMATEPQDLIHEEVTLNEGLLRLPGELIVPKGAPGLVVFAHGSGSSRHSPRNKYVAQELREGGLGTLLFDLLTADEEAAESYTRHLRFDIGLLAERVLLAVDWLHGEPETRGLRIGLFGSSTGAAAALVAAAHRPREIWAVVSRGGRPDLAGDWLDHVRVPTLLIVGGDDVEVLELNHHAHERLLGPKQLKSVPGASHLFQEPGALEEVAGIARDWFVAYLTPHRREERFAHA
jgi:putative phosphoribosyl transferase